MLDGILRGDRGKDGCLRTLRPPRYLVVNNTIILMSFSWAAADQESDSSSIVAGWPRLMQAGFVEPKNHEYMSNNTRNIEDKG